jgi:hypothetical protein
MERVQGVQFKEFAVVAAKTAGFSGNRNSPSGLWAMAGTGYFGLF